MTDRLTIVSGDDLPSLDEARSSVDALVSDEPSELILQPPPTIFRRATPSAPPGRGFGHAHPPRGPAASQMPAPVTPLKALGAASVVQPAKKAGSTGGAEARKNIKALAVESGLSKDIASSKSPAAVLKDQDFPALDTAKSTAHQPTPSTPAVVALPKLTSGKVSGSLGKKAAVEPPPSTGVTTLAETKKAEKKPAPGILNIAAATKAAQPKPAELESGASDLASFPTLPTPTTASVSSPITRSAPKTLRVLPSPKTEGPPILSAVPSAVDAKASIRSGGALVRPSTPASEIISDNASVVSASISASRTSSPPPSRIGSAAVRATTKSQQRKQRKQATKHEAASIASQPVIEMEAETAPILGRKKKQKKEKSSGSGATLVESVMEESRAATPVPYPLQAQQPAKEEPDSVASASAAAEPAPAEKTATKTKAGKASVASQSKGKGKEKEPETPATPAPTPAPKVVEEEAAAPKKPSSEKAQPTPHSVLQEMVAKGDLPNPEDVALLKPFPGLSHRFDSRDTIITTDVTIPAKTLFTDEDHDNLLAGKVVRKVVDGVRMMITPNGDCVRNLTEEEEERFLQLQMEVREASFTPSAYVHPRYEPAGGFALLKGRAVPNGPPSYFPPAPGSFPQDPISKIQREEAIYWINQYVLPRLNATQQSLEPHWKSAIADSAMAQTAGVSSIAPWIYNDTLGHDHQHQHHHHQHPH